MYPLQLFPVFFVHQKTFMYPLVNLRKRNVIFFRQLGLSDIMSANIFLNLAIQGFCVAVWTLITDVATGYLASAYGTDAWIIRIVSY